MNLLAKLRQRKKALLEEAAALNAKDDLSAEDQARLDELLGDDGDDSIKRLNARIERQIEIDEDLLASAAAVDLGDPEADRTGQVAAGQAGRVTEARGFATFGEQLTAIAAAGMNHGNNRAWDDRLVYQAASGANEAVPSEGGFLVQQDYSNELLDLMHDMGELITRVRRIPISGESNGIKLPAIDETSRADGSRFGGVQAYWANEGDTVSPTKPKFRSINLSLNKLMGVGYSTEELLNDSAALEAVMRTAFAEELTFKTEDAIFNGNGSGKPLGFMNSGALVTVAKESGQAAQTITTLNVLNMWSRLPVRSRRNAVWLCNIDVEPQLEQLTLGSGTAVQLMYRQPGSDGNNSEYGSLKGRPVIPIEYAATLGTAGDLVLFDPLNYVMIDKNGIKQATSMHVRFLYDEMAFRLTFRVDGQPVWKQALTPKNGVNTLSPYVALETRS